MTKDQSIKIFRDQVMPTIKDEEKEKNEGHPNHERRKQYWDKFMEIALNRGWITEEKFNRWTTPPFCDPERAQQNGSS